MILRRFMQHIKEQNWFAVGLDVIVVIVGIFLGIQVSNWNDERLLNNASAEFVELLKDDIKLAIELTQASYDRQAMRFKNGKDFLTNYKQISDEEDLTDSQLHGLEYITFFTIPNIEIGSLKIALSSEGNTLVRDTKVRGALVNFQRSYGRIDSVYDRILERIRLTEPVLNHYRSMQLWKSKNDDIDFDDIPMKFNFDKLQQSDEFEYAFQNALWGHHHAVRWARITKQQLEVLLTEINESTGS